MRSVEFFEDPTEQSRVKAAIVSKYFDAWAKVIKRRARSGRIGYFDLFAGPGRYDTGEPSTPVLILQKALGDPELRDMLVTVFNDKDAHHVASLKRVVSEIPGIGTLKHPPIFDSAEIGEKDAEFFESFKAVPSLFFLDPWGYKGLSLRLVNSVIGNWGCDCIFFFNYNRINPGLNNPMVKEHMCALFGEGQADALSQEVAGLDAKDRETHIVEALCDALGAKRGRFVLPFGFRNDEGTRTSHHLIFVSKNVLGYTIMKDIMRKESSSHNQGVATFQYSPADGRYQLLFELQRPLDDLEGLLVRDFAGKTLAMHQIFEQHHLGRPFVSSNYKEILKKMEARHLIRCRPNSAERRKNTLGDDVEITFPPEGVSVGKIKH
jgi:three-Cys-motif partner protein